MGLQLSTLQFHERTRPILTGGCGRGTCSDASVAKVVLAALDTALVPAAPPTAARLCAILVVLVLPPYLGESEEMLQRKDVPRRFCRALPLARPSLPLDDELSTDDESMATNTPTRRSRRLAGLDSGVQYAQVSIRSYLHRDALLT